ncbi:2-phosphosulfolactate phosphatase [Coprothermobacteraceae bacterium]|nr:2-phosphosulfolactate phosphatase [Coprothermobacteraceae bacterium]
MRVSVITSVSENLPEGSFVWIALDVIRATTTMITFLASGGRSIYVTDDIAEAIRMKEHDPSLLLIGERNGLKIEGFDFDNSPTEVLANLPSVKDRRAVMTTTNGTRLIKKLNGSVGPVLVGALVNMSAVVEKAYVEASKLGLEGVGIACAGKDGRLVADDLYCAGLIVRKLKEFSAGVELDDAAKVAEAAAGEWQNALQVLVGSESGRNILRYGKVKDIEFCAQLDAAALVPTVASSWVTA